MGDRNDLAEFLRGRRQAIAPADVGLAAGPRRRTAGLRREEVAHLAGVSVSWYTWLEQGRPINVSRDVLRALARALRLDDVESDHLFLLAGKAVAGAHRTDGDAPPWSHRLLATLEPAPAYLLGPHWEYLAWNDQQARLVPELPGLDGLERNLVWVMFGLPSIRSLLPDWEQEARQVLSEFRADTTTIRDDPVVAALVARLRDVSAEFDRWWVRHDVAGFRTRLRRFQHPVAGALTFEYQQLLVAGAPDLRVVIQLPVDEDDSATRLAAVPLPT